jgi:Protein of unknown function (DUF2510)
MGGVGTSQGLSLSNLELTVLWVVTGAFSGAIAYMRTAQCRRQTGRNPWGIPPGAWFLGGLVFLLIGALLAEIASAMTHPRPAEPAPSVAGPAPWAPTSTVEVVRPAPVEELAPAPVAAPPVPTGPPAGWYADPAGVHQHRWWDGTGWGDQVVDDGFGRSDPLPPYPG